MADNSNDYVSAINSVIGICKDADALSHQLPGELRSLVERQSEQVQLAHNRIKALRDAAAIK